MLPVGWQSKFSGNAVLKSRHCNEIHSVILVDCLLFKFAIQVAGLNFTHIQKSSNEIWLRNRTDFSTISEMALKIPI